MLLAGLGFTVVTGGYGGVMEAACRGAQEAGGRTIGVICDIFLGRLPNPYLSEVVATRDLHDRTRELIERALGYVVLEGRAGTLAELAFLWALNRAGCLGGKPVVLLGDLWRPIVEQLKHSGVLAESQLRVTYLSDTAEEAVQLLSAGLDAARGT